MEIHPLRKHARILTAALVGTAVEFYDFFIYATSAALVFGPLFFPMESKAAQTLLAFMTFGIAFIARPIGAVAFGHFGDRVGRKSTLVAALLLMGTSTLVIGFLPTYALIGWVAPMLLCLCRFGQGLGLGGEWGGAALLAVENAPKGWEARFGAAPQLGVPLGFMAANGLFLVLGATLSDKDFLDWGWRVPFLASSVLVALGLWVRLKIAETPEFRAVLERERPLPVPIASLLSDHLGAVLAGTAGVVSTFSLFYLATAYALAQGTAVAGFPRETFLGIQLVANVFLAIGGVAASTYADRTSARGTILWGALATMMVGFLFSPALASGSLPLTALMLIIAMLVLAFTNAPLGYWLSQLFPVRVRYSGVSLSFNAAGIIGGALTPVVAQMMSAEGLAGYTGMLLVVAGLVSLVGVKLSRPQASHGHPSRTA